VTGVAQDDKGRTDLMLDRTILYPQGGGQAWDTGTIRSAHAAFQVQEVRFIDGIVHHYGMVTEGSFAAGDAVTLQVDAARRLLNSRLHTGGHLIDEAVRNLALAWMPTKGIHYPGQAAVEFTGEVTDAEALRQQIEHEVNRLIQAGYVTKAELVDLETLAQRAHFVLPNLPKDKPIRIVTVWGEKGVPCGGTHVANISEVGKLAVRYVKAKKGEIKVAYELAG
jgi:Ser-tRNA(Ala) deacylase AlaX